MLENNEITYLFGAGASYKSMPLVNSFCDRYEIYIKFLERIAAKNDFVRENRNFIREIKSHLSFDTFLRSYIIKKTEVKIFTKENITYLFFLFEHLIDTGFVNQITKDLGFKYPKEYGLDPRYDALIAGLLKPLPQECKFYCNINFLTWNYDLNLTYSIFNFLGQNISFEAFINGGRKANNVFEFSEQLKTIHLNGYINPVEIVGGGFGCHPLENLQGRFQKLIANYSNDEYVEDKVSSLNFSWESVSKDNSLPEFIIQATGAVSRSRSIIIIGYSLPLYNRLFDLTILDKEKLNNKSIYIINPNASELKKIIHSDFGIQDTEGRDNYMVKPGTPNVYVSNVSDYFFVPPNLF